MRGLNTCTKAFRSACALLLLVVSTQAQTLAHRNWVGSGLSAEPWWRSAVFYRIAPATFQDSDGDGIGDLRGVAQRMTYLQSLSVDAVVLTSNWSDEGFDDLLREASGHRIRVVVSLDAAQDNDMLSATARQWLTRGSAGVWLHVAARSAPAHVGTAIQSLRKLIDTFPGQRVLIEDTSDDPAVIATPGAQLVTRSVLDGVGGVTDALSLRVQLGGINNVPAGSSPIIMLQHRQNAADLPDKQHDGLNKILASLLFLSRGAAVLDAGQEIDSDTVTEAKRAMPWTPSNVTRVPEPETPEPVSKSPPRKPEDVYGPFVPYVAPVAKAVRTTPDLNALPGFSSAAVASFPADAHTDVATENSDQNSLLNFYRHLSQLHHENASIRSGDITVLRRDADNVLLWLRHPSKQSGAAGQVLVAANLTTDRKAVSVADEFASQGRMVTFLPLLSSAALNVQTLQRSAAIVIAPWSVVVLSSRH